MPEREPTIDELKEAVTTRRHASLEATEAALEGRDYEEPELSITDLRFGLALAERRHQLKTVYVLNGGNQTTSSPPVTETYAQQPPQQPRVLSAPSPASRKPAASLVVVPPRPPGGTNQGPNAEQPATKANHSMSKGWLFAGVAAAVALPVSTAAIGYKMTSEGGAPITTDRLPTTPSHSAKVQPGKHPNLVPEQSPGASSEDLPSASPTQPAPTTTPDKPESTPSVVTTVAPPPPATAPPAPTETTATIGPTKLITGTFNGEHIGNDSVVEYTARMHKSVNVIKGLAPDAPLSAEPDPDTGIDFIGVQEWRPEQQRLFKQMAGERYAIYPDLDKPSQSYSPNIILYDKTKYRLIKTSTYSYTYFHKTTMYAPIAMLQSRETGQIVKEAVGHLPADTKDNGMNNEDLRHNNIDHLINDVFGPMISGHDNQEWQTGEDESATESEVSTAQTIPIFFEADTNGRYATFPGENQNEPYLNDMDYSDVCRFGGPNGYFDDALAVLRGMSKAALCDDHNQMSDNGGGSVDHSYDWGAEVLAQIAENTTPAQAGSDHSPKFFKYLINAHTIIVPIGSSQKQLVGASN